MTEPDRIERIYYDKHKTILKEEIPYKNNRINGIRKEYHENGTTYECAYKDGEKDGAEREYSDTGTLMSETWYVNGAADGPFAVLSSYKTWTVGEEPFTIPETIGRRVQGSYEGLIEHYTGGMISETEIYSGGKKLRATQWANGIRHGTDACYDTSKNPVRVVLYDKGEISQISKGENLKLGPEYDYGSYSGNEAYKKTLPLDSFPIATYWRIDNSIDGVSVPKEEYTIRKGVAEGTRKEYYSDPHHLILYIDRIEAATPYKSGRVNGTARAYYYSGMLFSEIVFADGEKNGPAKYYKDRPAPLQALGRLTGKPEKVLYFRRGMRTGAAN